MKHANIMQLHDNVVAYIDNLHHVIVSLMPFIDDLCQVIVVFRMKHDVFVA